MGKKITTFAVRGHAGRFVGGQVGQCSQVSIQFQAPNGQYVEFVHFALLMRDGTVRVHQDTAGVSAPFKTEEIPADAVTKHRALLSG